MNLKLRELRKKQNLTQMTLGELLGISHRNISKYETGLIMPDIDTLISFADFFNVSLDYLVGREYVDYIADSQKENLNVSETNFLNEYNKYDKGQQCDLINIVANVKSNEIKILNKYLSLPSTERSKAYKILEAAVKVYDE